MPDPAKLEALRSAGARVVPTCETCATWTPAPDSRSGWGRCPVILYEHAKHGGSEAGMPRNGQCPQHEVDFPRLVGLVGDYLDLAGEL